MPHIKAYKVLSYLTSAVLFITTTRGMVERGINAKNKL
jgi:hypothetical protein